MIGAVAVADVGRGAVEHAADALHRHLERVGSDLCEGGLEPLANGGGADVDGVAAVRLQHDARALFRPSRAALDEAAQRNAVIAPVDQLAGQLRFRGPVDLREAAVERDVIVAAVELVLGLERGDGRDLVRHLRVRHEVAAAELDAVEPEILRHHVEEALAEEIGLEPARAPIGADRRLVGEVERDIDVDVGNAIGARHELGDVARAHRAVGAHVGADIDEGVAAQCEDGAVACAGDLDIAFRFTRVVHRHQVLAAVLGPFHRPAGAARRERDQEILRIVLAAGAEAATHVVLDELDRALRDVELLGQRPAIEEQHLGSARERQVRARRVPFRQQAAWLHRKRHVALGAETFAAGIGRILERGDGIAAHGVEHHGAVAVGVGEQQGVLGQGRVPVGDHRQLLDIDLDQADGILGDAGGLGEHERDRLADIAHLGLGDDWLAVLLEIRQRLQPHGHAWDAIAHILDHDVLRRDHGMHARQRACRRGVDGADAAMGDRAAQDGRVQGILAREVVDILAAAAQEAKILAPFDRAADEGIDRLHARSLARSLG